MAPVHGAVQHFLVLEGLLEAAAQLGPHVAHVSVLQALVAPPDTSSRLAATACCLAADLAATCPTCAFPWACRCHSFFVSHDEAPSHRPTQQRRQSKAARQGASEAQGLLRRAAVQVWRHWKEHVSRLAGPRPQTAEGTPAAEVPTASWTAGVAGGAGKWRCGHRAGVDNSLGGAAVCRLQEGMVVRPVAARA